MQQPGQYQGSLLSATDGTRDPNDIIVGADGDDFISGGREGDDVIVAGAGNDIIGRGDRIGFTLPDFAATVGFLPVELDEFRVDAGAGNDFVYTSDYNPMNDGFIINAVVDLGSGNDSYYSQGAQSNITGTGNNHSTRLSLHDGRQHQTAVNDQYTKIKIRKTDCSFCRDSLRS